MYKKSKNKNKKSHFQTQQPLQHKMIFSNKIMMTLCQGSVYKILNVKEFYWIYVLSLKSSDTEAVFTKTETNKE